MYGRFQLYDCHLLLYYAQCKLPSEVVRICPREADLRQIRALTSSVMRQIAYGKALAGKEPAQKRLQELV